MHEAINLPAYFERIGYRGNAEPSVENLRAIHLAHATRIPFENLDVLLGRPIRLDLPSLQAKLIDNKRGGYCFEQNLLLAAVLEQLGFRRTRLLARVRWWTHHTLPRTHMVLKVDIDGQSWLADVGFGGWGLLEPMRLAEHEAKQFDWSFRLAHDGAIWKLQTFAPPFAAMRAAAASRRAGIGHSARPDATDGQSARFTSSRDALEPYWQDAYEFSLDPQLPVDYEPANHYVSTHRDSRFTQTLTAGLPSPQQRCLLINYDLIEAQPDGVRTRRISGDEELLQVLAERFGLTMPKLTRFKIISDEK